MPFVTVFAGTLFFFTPYSQNIEENIGLDWLFNQRGPVSAPEDVVIVGMDLASSQELKLRNRPNEWPRALHTRMVEKLTELGAGIIVYDIRFEQPGDSAQDEQLIEAIARAGNVLLFQYLYRKNMNIFDPASKTQGSIQIERRFPLISGLESAAVGLAPFPLPRVPIKVNQSWLFKGGAGDIATLPMIAFLAYNQSSVIELWELIKSLNHDFSRVAGKIDVAQLPLQQQARMFRNLFHNYTGLARQLIRLITQRRPKIPEQRGQQLRRLIAAFKLNESHYLNYYGPPHTIKTLPFYQVLSSNHDALHPELNGKAVFIGFSERLQPEQQDHFYTVFTDETALDISGVEIMATAFSNLLEGRAFNPLPRYMQLLIFFAGGIGLCLLFRFFTVYWMLLVSIASGLLYLLIALFWFTYNSLWLPVTIPLMIQLPVALIGSILWRYLEKHEESTNIRKALSMYIPSRFVDDLADNIEALHNQGQIVHGACLATDAGQYTKLSESMELEYLHNLMNQYYETVFEPVRRNGGSVSDVMGDAVLAIWASDQLNKTFRARVCESALGIDRAVASFNQHNPDLQLPTRIGLHCGEMLLGNVGAMDHYEFRALGDIVNTSTRIEGLNKVLGTNILAAGAMIEGLEQFVYRELGWFRLAGKTQPVQIFELITHRSSARSDEIEKLAVFDEALAHFHKRMWQQAAERFQQLCSSSGGDGPSSYYLRLCNQFSEHAPDTNWGGIHLINTK